MATRDAVFALLCAALCVLAVVAPTAAAQESTASGPGVEPLVQQGVEPDSTRIVVEVSERGDARWEIQYWTRLDDENTTEAFRSLQDDVRANPDDYTAAFAERIASTVGAAENATGREMAATNVSVAAETRSLPDSFGVVSYSFEWSNFAAVDGDRLVVGDAIEGFFLDSSSRLILSWPDDYGATTVEPAGDETRENAVIWRGTQTEFVSGEPNVVLERGAGGSEPSATPTPTPTPGDSETPAAGDDPFPTTTALIALALALVVLVGAGAVYLRSRGALGGGDGGAGAVDATGGTDADAPADSTAATADEAGSEPAADDAATSRATADAGADTAAADDTDESDASDDGEPSPPPELLSNEERVLRLIESRGGRIKQQEVAGALDWTDAKTSKVVRGMRDEGTIEGFRLGRENVLRLPEDDDGGADAPDGDGDSNGV
ncbi:helix-turn-helix transcriptional regulator [Haloferax volcanii]|uniref:helix-turn-helix transcriptional regulator n=1 Tax=Haloferax volcanii TaxID=2246 RepID=UPI003853BC7A